MTRPLCCLLVIAALACFGGAGLTAQTSVAAASGSRTTVVGCIQQTQKTASNPAAAPATPAVALFALSLSVRPVAHNAGMTTPKGSTPVSSNATVADTFRRQASAVPDHAGMMTPKGSTPTRWDAATLTAAQLTAGGSYDHAGMMSPKGSAPVGLNPLGASAYGLAADRRLADRVGQVVEVTGPVELLAGERILTVESIRTVSSRCQ
jgi:hypothetical protein